MQTYKNISPQMRAVLSNRIDDLEKIDWTLRQSGCVSDQKIQEHHCFLLGFKAALEALGYKTKTIRGKTRLYKI